MSLIKIQLLGNRVLEPEYGYAEAKAAFS
jgi:hypothetical protein